MEHFTLRWLEYTDGRRTSKQKDSPSDIDVVDLLDRLSLTGTSALTLGYGGTAQDAEATLGISGEPGAYICFVAYCDDRIFELHDPQASNKIIRREVGGQYEEYPASLLVNRDACIGAIRHFLQTGQHSSTMVHRTFPSKPIP